MHLLVIQCLHESCDHLVHRCHCCYCSIQWTEADVVLTAVTSWGSGHLLLRGSTPLTTEILWCYNGHSLQHVFCTTITSSSLCFVKLGGSGASLPLNMSHSILLCFWHQATILQYIHEASLAVKAFGSANNEEHKHLLLNTSSTLGPC